MKKLEFLLQKEGDRAWLPLETPDVEILEGRYRVVARVPHPNADIEIRVSYTSLLQVPPQRQVQSRSTRTNPEGLVVIIPYTRLKPGKWELSCLADPESKPAKPWQYGVQLEVLQAESETLEPLQPIDSTELTSSTIDSELAAAADRATPIPEPQPTKIYQFPIPQPPQPKSPYNLQIVLDRETFVTQLGRPLIISGKIDLPQTSRKNPTPIPESQTAELTKLIGSAELQIYLRDPQTSQVLAEIQQPMPEQLPPCIFGCVTYIPAESKSRLILGEAILRIGNATLSTQVFTITARLEQLLDVIEDNFGEQKYKTEPSLIDSKQAPIEPNLSFLKLVEKSLDSAPTADQTNQTLPPKLSSHQDKSVNNKLELPTFGRKLADSNREKLLSEIAKSPQTEVATQPPDVKLDSPALPSDIANSLEKVEVPAIDQKPENSPQPETAAAETQPAPTKQAFQTLNVENRFWSRLSSFVSKGESPEWLNNTSLSPTPKVAENTREEIVGVEESIPTPPPVVANESPIPEPKSNSWEAREFVIFDEPAPQAPKNLGEKKTRVVEAEVTPLTSYVLGQDEVVPMPVIEPPREIVAGKLVKVRVQLPELMPRIFVKIWVYDRQTYVILDGPRWITEFAANGLGNVQAMAELEIPYGCMEIEFEAIAVEMQTQRESDKITVHRQVLPPSGPTLPLDG
ncbi:MAG: hypothetical protein QQW96_24585 [Tychonema bourrellyi B0820]|uniref:Uncharacterized protein n=1 Tax=Tychonema bourrellyi FEM_GT703 TaxID=2040638 RepID=A0A2G4EXU7_9CYAN|nr:hypothetical protein [Tychonema bourrellyi]MDQ2100810.1 hypothetical protein [Tychonema bourrellyi B0820]PHX54364.1 hypothetical protein CP500_016550 [Tychonema bourrellyi FEM_GT703]